MHMSDNGRLYHQVCSVLHFSRIILTFIKHSEIQISFNIKSRAVTERASEAYWNLLGRKLLNTLTIAISNMKMSFSYLSDCINCQSTHIFQTFDVLFDVNHADSAHEMLGVWLHLHKFKKYINNFIALKFLHITLLARSNFYISLYYTRI